MTEDVEGLSELLNDVDFKFSDHFVFRSMLGFGGFGKVVEAISKSTFEVMAVKIIEKKRVHTKDMEKIKGEAEMLNYLDHRHIVKLKHIHESANKLYLAMEKMNGGSLQNLTVNSRKASVIIRGVLEAVAYMHERDIAHRDLKPENVMLEKEGDPSSVKILDFGLSARRWDAQSLTEKCGTTIFMAPEVFLNREYSKYVDIWSVGLIMFMLLTGYHPLFEKGDTTEN